MLEHINTVLFLTCVLLVFCLLLTLSRHSNEGYQTKLIDNSGGAPLIGEGSQLGGLQYNNNMAWFPAIGFARPSFRQCYDYALKVGKGELTDEANTKLIMCVQQAGMRPWLKNLPISSPGV